MTTKIHAAHRYIYLHFLQWSNAQKLIYKFTYFPEFKNILGFSFFLLNWAGFFLTFMFVLYIQNSFKTLSLIYNIDNDKIYNDDNILYR